MLLEKLLYLQKIRKVFGSGCLRNLRARIQAYNASYGTRKKKEGGAKLICAMIRRVLLIHIELA